MFQLQMKWMSKGNWENTVYRPMPYSACYKIWKHQTDSFPEHSYRILSMMETK